VSEPASRRTTSRQLGVSLEFDKAVDDLNAGALQIARPTDVGLLIENAP